jgi:hypothetical protein
MKTIATLIVSVALGFTIVGQNPDLVPVAQQISETAKGLISR